MADVTPRVLVIDDDERVTRLVEAHIGMKGWGCATALDGPRGFALAADGGFDLVLVDLGLPGMDGLAIVRELRRVAPGTPVIVMTGSATAENAIRSLRHGATDFLTKPFHLKTLDEALMRAVSGKTARDAGASQTTAVGAHDALTADHAPALHRSLNTLLTLLEPSGNAAQSSGGAARSGPGDRGAPDDRLAAAAELLVRVLALPDEEARRMRWAVRLLTLPPETLAGLEAVAEAARAARARTERWDGTGHPGRMSGDAIPLVARCLAVAEALAKAANPGSSLPVDDARTVLRLGSGTAFDPAVAAACLALPDVELLRIASMAAHAPTTAPVPMSRRPTTTVAV